MAINSLHAPLSALVLLVAFGRDALPAALEPRLLWVGGGALLCGIVGNTVFTLGLKGVSAAAGSSLTYLEPLTAAVVGWLVFSESLGVLGVVGGLVVLGTGIWVASAPRGPAAPLKAAPGVS